MPVIAHQRIVAGSGRPSLSDLVAAFPTSLFPLAGRQDGRMAMSETELLALLRELDDPERLERPLNYDRAAASLAFGGLVRLPRRTSGSSASSSRTCRTPASTGGSAS